MSDIKLAIAIISQDIVHKGFSVALAAMMYHLGRIGLPASVVDTRCSTGPDKARYDSVMAAKQADATHILFIDSDQVFPYITAIKLLAHKQPIVGCVIPQRIHPYALNARHKGGQRIQITEDDKGLLEVYTLGTGIMLIDMAVFEKLKKPYFETKFHNDDWQSEDESFCVKAQLAGYRVYADIDLSRQVVHLGEQGISLAN